MRAYVICLCFTLAVAACNGDGGETNATSDTSDTIVSNDVNSNDVIVDVIVDTAGVDGTLNPDTAPVDVAAPPGDSVVDGATVDAPDPVDLVTPNDVAKVPDVADDGGGDGADGAGDSRQTDVSDIGDATEPGDMGAPTDTIPDTSTLDTACSPSCAGKACGNDGCGGSCGECLDGICTGGQCNTGGCVGNCGGSGDDACWCDEVCFMFGDCCSNVCLACGTDFPDNCCTPDCEGKVCGFDGCYGDCGSCSAGTKCDDHVCIPCTGDCTGKLCGDDGCNGSCGTCGDGLACKNFACVPCTPHCTNKECGDDGCDGTCGECATGENCKKGKCTTPDSCENKCGDFGGLCFCSADCVIFGDCCADFCDVCGDMFEDACCEPQCADNECGADGCGGLCGLCLPGTKCDGTACIPCAPECDGKNCGDDNCGGKCGTCGKNEICNASGVCEACFPQCSGATACQPDGCGGFCACPVDCNNLNPGPIQPVLIPNAIASEGLAFDGEGNLVGGDIGSIYKSTYDGKVKVFVPGLKQRAGIAYLPDGNCMVNDDFTGTVWRVSPQGVKTAVVTGLVYPNGIAVDKSGTVFVTEDTQDLVLQINPYGFNDYIVLADGKFGHPNGVTFNAAYDALYIAACPGDGHVWRMKRNPDGTFQEPEKWSIKLGSCLDSLEQDICGNWYILDYAAGGVIRLAPDGQSYKVIVPDAYYFPNLQWGTGIGGWSPTRMYGPNGSTFQVYEMDVGVPMKPRVFPPMPPMPPMP